MGTFIGHFVPESFALALGFYWSVQMWNIYFQCWNKGLKFVWVDMTNIHGDLHWTFCSRIFCFGTWFVLNCLD